MSGSAEGLEAAALAECANEPIRVPGAIQPHGLLIAVHEPTLRVAVVSDNAATMVGRRPADLVGALLTDTLGPDAAEALRAAATHTPLDEVNPVVVEVDTADGSRRFDAVLHRAGGLLVVDLEVHVTGEETTFRALRGPVRRLQAAWSVTSLAEVVAREVRSLTGYDRVMVYRFDPQWNGEVIAEERRPDLTPYLGLHYPASDIPPQARDLYLSSWSRLIADVDATPACLVPDANPLDGGPLDLSHSTLRAVSPFHLEYLRNMGVGSSMSISLIDRGRLWGLVACHHDVPHRPSYTVRSAAELLGRIASLLLATLADVGDQHEALSVSAALTDLLRHVSVSTTSIGAGLAGDPRPLLAVGGATGAAIRLGQEVHLVGATPPPDRLDAVVEAVLGASDEDLVATDALSVARPDLADVQDLASGVLAVRLTDLPDQWIAWFRPEVIRSVEWGGDPGAGKVHLDDDGTPRLHPRSSFQRWSETVRQRSLPWGPHELAAAGALGRHITDVSRERAHQEARTAATLQHALLLEHLPTIPGISLQVRYLPAEHDAVGGDWYDLFLLADERVGITLGDVAGHGIGVAGIMAQLRHGLRAYLLREASPGAALDRLNELTHRLLPRELATVVVADLEPATGRLRVASAGHLPPLVVPAGGGAPFFLEGARGPALGLLPDSTYGHHEVVLGAGDTLLAYTDGLVERRDESIDVGLTRLAERAREPDADLDAYATRLVGDDSNPDDVTLLVLRAEVGPRPAS